MASLKRYQRQTQTDIKWLDRPLQGLAYWMGLRDCYFDNYPLGESALVAELCNLLASKAPARRGGKRMVVAPEHALAYLRREPLPGGRGRHPAVDLVLGWRRKGPGGIDPVLCIEVKRRSAGDYEEDLDRLADARRVGGGRWRGLVVLTSQGERPHEFLGATGRALRRLRTTAAGTWYRARRIYKALSTRSEKSSKGYWVTLLEIDPPAIQTASSVAPASKAKP